MEMREEAYREGVYLSPAQRILFDGAQEQLQALRERVKSDEWLIKDFERTVSRLNGEKKAVQQELKQAREFNRELEEYIEQLREQLQYELQTKASDCE